MVWAAAWLGPTLPTVDHLASWGGWELDTQSFPCRPRQVPKSCMVTGDRRTQSPLLPLKARTPEVLTPSVVTFSWDARRNELPPVTSLKHEKWTSSARESRRMASPATPNDRGAPYIQKADRLGEGEPPHGGSGDSQGSGCTSRRCYQLESIHQPITWGTHAMTAVLCRLHRSREAVSPHGESDDSQGSSVPRGSDAAWQAR